MARAKTKAAHAKAKPSATKPAGKPTKLAKKPTKPTPAKPARKPAKLIAAKTKQPTAKAKQPTAKAKQPTAKQPTATKQAKPRPAAKPRPTAKARPAAKPKPGARAAAPAMEEHATALQKPTGAGRVLEILDDAHPIDALRRFLASIGGPASVQDSQIALGSAQLMLLPIAREHRGGPEVQELLDLILSVWPRLIPVLADRGGFHAQEFLRNAFAAVGDDRARLDRLLELVPDSPSTELRFNIASALAIIGDKPAMLPWLRAAMVGGATPDQIRRDPDFIELLDDPDFIGLLDGASAPAIPVSIEAHVRPVRAALDALLSTLGKLGQPATKNPPASLDAVLAAERTRRIQLPNDYRALLTITDGLAIWDNTFLGTSDYSSDTPLAQNAREYLEMSAHYGATGIDACVPIANWGQPNDWLLYDPLGHVRGEPGYVLMLNADERPIDDLVSALERIGRIASDVLGTN